MELDEYMTSEEAAEYLGVNRSRISQLIKSGELEAKRFGKSWAISAESVRRRKENNPGPGNPNFGPGYSRHVKSGLETP